MKIEAEALRPQGDVDGPAAGRAPEAEEGAVQPALPERHRPAREHRARQGGPPRHRPRQDAAARRSAPQPARLEEKPMPKRILQGVVVSDKQDKTVVVKVERRFTHPRLKKTVRRTKNYHAHDEANTCQGRRQVSIEESKPISKLKTWVRRRRRRRRRKEFRRPERSAARRRFAHSGRQAALGALCTRQGTQIPVRRSPARQSCLPETGLKQGKDQGHDPDADESRRRRQFRRASRDVHQGSRRLEAQIRLASATSSSSPSRRRSRAAA